VKYCTYDTVTPANRSKTSGSGVAGDPTAWSAAGATAVGNYFPRMIGMLPLVQAGVRG